jgi:2-dehydro-3-deoxyphosphogluconate aldolase / (4S)-4-hydroxy-2-oxoglutarate aldolase
MAGALSDVLEQLCARGVVPVVVVDDLDVARSLGDALKAGGLPVAEVTFRTAAAADALRVLALDPDLLVGAGTVVRPEQVDLAASAGARFVVTPGFSTRVVARCRELDMPVIPGVATATEVIEALDHGCELLKFFPAETSGGLAMLRALHGPFPEVRFIPTGGIGRANAAEYLGLASVAAVGGSWMVAGELVRAGDFATVSKLAAESVRIAAEARA